MLDGGVIISSGVMIPTNAVPTQALKEARECAAKAEVEAENLRRRLDMVGDGPAAGTINHAGVVREGDLAAMEEENRWGFDGFRLFYLRIFRP